jgi:hypothetical protein
MSICLFCARGSVSVNALHISCIDRNGLDKETKKPTFYINVKSEELQDILRGVLIDLYGVSLMEDKPSVGPFLQKGINMPLT